MFSVTTSTCLLFGSSLDLLPGSFKLYCKCVPEEHCVMFSDMVRRWCTLEGGFLSYYDNERSLSPIGRVDVTEVVSLAISSTETMTGAG